MSWASYENVWEITDRSKTLVEEPYIYVMEDPNDNVRIEDVTEIYKDRFIELKLLDVDLQHSNSAFWIRVHLVNLLDSNAHLIIRKRFNLESHIQYYLANDSNITFLGHSGSNVSYEERTLPHTLFFATDFHLEKEKNTHLFIKFKTKGMVNFDVVISSYEEFYRDSEGMKIILFIYLGIMMAAITLVLLFGFILRKQYAFYFAAYSVAMAFSVFVYCGMDHRFFPFLNKGLADYISIILALNLFFYLLFSESFLNFKGSRYYLDWIVNGLMGYTLLSGLLFVAGYYNFLLPINNFTVVLYIIFMMFLSAFVYPRNRFRVTFYLLSSSGFLFGVLLFGLMYLNILEANNFVRFSVVWAHIIQMVIITFILTLETIRKQNKQTHSYLNEFKEKDLFLKCIGHELRTPLNGLRGSIELLKKTKLSPRMKELVEVAESCEHEIFTVIENYFEISENYTEAIEDKDVDLVNQLMADMKNHSHQCSQKGLHFEYILPDNLLHLVKADGYILLKLVKSMIQLSTKMTKQGFVNFNAEIVAEEPEVLYFKFTVQDSCMDVPSEIRTFVCENTELEVNYQSELFREYMLEMFMVKQIARILDVKIRFSPLNLDNTTIGGQYSFSICLEKTGFLSEKMIFNKDIELDYQLHILLAEDNLVNQKVMGRLLERMGHLVTTVNNGIECVKAYKESHFDMVILDVQMPKLNGVEAAREIRTIEKNARKAFEIPIIAISARSKKELLALSDQEIFTDILQKPISFELLRGRIDAQFNS